MFEIHDVDKQRSFRQRVRANPSLPEIPKLGEHVYFKQAKMVKILKEESKWKTRIWIGFIDHTNEHIIGTPRGNLTCRAIRRE